MKEKNTPCTAPAASPLHQDEKIPVRVLLGPTASGKSALALELALKHGYEILSCDSRQIYRKMNIGTAKPALKEREQVLHWFIDLLDPSEEYAAFKFGREAQALIRERAALGKQVIVCGGTGFYFNALAQGAHEAVASDPEIRSALMAESVAPGGAQKLHDELCRVDPSSGRRIHQNDIQRVVRALAVFRQTGKPFSEQHSTGDLPVDFEFRIAKLDIYREELYEKINNRVDRMVNEGLYEEFLGLLSGGYSAVSPGLQTVGYRELFMVSSGCMQLPDAIEVIKQHTRNFAKRQITWFKTQVGGAAFRAGECTAATLDEFYRF